MASPTEISCAQLSRLIGTTRAPVLLDVRTDEDFAADPRLLPASRRCGYQTVAELAPELAGRQVIVICDKGLKLSQGAAAWLRHGGVEALTLTGGFAAWRASEGLLVNTAKLPPRDAKGRTAWVTRARPKIDRIACPWLIRRFVDPEAVFLFVAPSEVLAVAERFGGAAFDIDDVFWSHRGETCTFDTMLTEFGLHSPALGGVALIVRAADTARLDLAPEAAGLLAASLGFSQMHRDDLTQLDAAMPLYDAFYRWRRDASAETHNWPAVKGAAL